MSTQVQHRRGTDAQHEAFTGAMSEITHDTTNNNLRVHDGSKPGGYRTLMEHERGVAGGVASLDEDGAVPASQLRNAQSSVFEAKANVEAAQINPNIHAISIISGDAAGAYIDTDNGSTDTLTSDDGRTWYRVQDIGDDRLAAPANITYLNQTETTLEFYGGDVVEMFSVSPARKFSIGPGNIEFNEPFSIPAGAHLSIDRSAVFVPTFEPVGPDRATPLITLGTGVIADNLRAHLEAGINTIRILFKVGTGCQVGYVEATSTDLNNNRTEPGATDIVSGALLVEGQHVRIGQAYFNRFDRGWCVVNSQNVVIEKVRNLETVMGGYVHGSRDLHVLAGYTTGPNDPTEPNPHGRGVMTPGANSLLLAGCSDSSFGVGGGWMAFDMLEHAIRVGQRAAGTSVPNRRLLFGSMRLIRPYGCGFKMDDAGDFAIKHVQTGDIYTEDVGNGNWFGEPGYTNWQHSPGDSPGLDNDGNKEAVAIRNSQYVVLGNIMNRASPSKQYSGYIGVFIQRSNNVSTGTIDTEKSRTDGVVIQSGGATSPERIFIPAVRSVQNGGDGVKLNAQPSAAVWRDVQVLNINAQGNGGYGVSATLSSGGTSPYTTLNSRIEGCVGNNTAGGKNIPSPVSGDTNFIDNVTVV